MITESSQKTEEFGQKLGGKIKKPLVICLNGELGVGKTCFVKGFVKGLGIEKTVTSPTFALVNVYKGKTFLIYHFDMYRINGYSDLESIGFFDFLSEEAIIIIEWSDKISEFLPSKRMELNFFKLGEYKRKILIKGENLLKD